MRASRLLRTLPIPLALYALALVGLLWQISGHPAFPYNWESYTAWNFWVAWTGPRPDAAEILAVTDGLMTDSGRGPLLGIPIWLGFWRDGVGLAALRWPVALIAALAVPLTWELGRRLTSPPVGLLAALLLAVSPVFLLYGRTATLVGISLVPALLTMLALIRLLESSRPRAAVAWLVALQGCLVLGAYAYAPVRLLWPLVLLVLLLAAIAWPGRRRLLVIAALVTGLSLPAFLIVSEWLTRGVWSPAPVVGYFRVRGEQIFELGADPDRYLPYLRQPPAGTTEPWRLAWNLVSQNLGDAVLLLTDWQTEPVVTHYWHPRGQLWAWPLVPFFWLGFAGLGYRALAGRSWRAWLMLLLLLGLTLPLLLTTLVHVGRLVPALPLFLLTVGWGLSLAAAGVARVAAGRLPVPASTVRLATMSCLGTLVILSSAATALRGYDLLPAASQESRLAARLATLVSDVAEHGGAGVVAPAAYGLEVEGVRAGTYWLALNADYRLVDLSRPTASPPADDRRPPLYVVGVLPRLVAGELPNACGNLYLVVPEAAAEFQEVAGLLSIRQQCPAGLDYELLPE